MQLHEFVDGVTTGEPPLAHSADDIIAAGRKVERRRRAGFASAGAAGLVAVAVAGSFALPHFGGKSSPNVAAPAAAARTQAARTQAATWTDAAFSFNFQAFKAGKFQVQDPTVTSTAYEIASVYATGFTSNDKPSTATATSTGTILQQKEAAKHANPTLYAYLTVYKKGAFDASKIADGTPVTVAGHKAVQAQLPVGLDPKNGIDPGNKELAWQYADNAWAVVTSISSDQASPSFTDLSAIVSGLKPSTPTPALLPFTVGYVPVGYAPVQTGTTVMPGLDGIAAAREGDFGGATFASPAPAATGLSQPFDTVDGTIKNSFNIFVTPSKNSNQQAQAGKTKCYSGGFCNVWNHDGSVQVQISDEGTGANLSASELTKIAHSIKVADVKAQSTWTPATKALQP